MSESEVIKPAVKPPTSQSKQGTADKYLTVQLGAFRNSSGIKAIRDQLKEKPVFIYQLNNGLMAVSTGQFDSLEQAKKQAVLLRKEGFSGAYVTELPMQSEHIREY